MNKDFKIRGTSSCLITYTQTCHEYVHVPYNRNVACVAAYRLMGRLRLVGSMKLQVSYAEYSLFYEALLQKRPMILSILLTVATP